MNELLANRSFRVLGLAAAGLILTACGQNGSPAHQEVVGKPIKNLECVPHNYDDDNPGRISVVVRDRGSGNTKDLQVTHIITRLPNNPPVSKVAHHNEAQFDIPADYSEVDVKATLDGYAGVLGCGSLAPKSEY